MWTQDGRYVRPVKVSIGLSDGTMTEVQGDEVKEGMEVIIGEQRQGATDSDHQPLCAPDDEKQPLTVTPASGALPGNRTTGSARIME